MPFGTIYLVGAGPGDPGLITVRGRDLLRTADVIVYDRLVSLELLRDTRPGAECIYVGKASAAHSMKQADINALLVDRARAGLSVVRLKGGDPFVFGRGGEEAEACLDADIAFEIVPGITSAIAAPAYAGIPVTHRDSSSSFMVITGHERDDSRESGTRTGGAAEGRRNWSLLANAADTLIFLMGVENLPEITARLLENGRDLNTPVALIQWGTWLRQRVVTGTLATIVEVVRSAGITPPAVCVVGDVVTLRSSLSWFDNSKRKPLFGKRILVTRAREQASGLSELLRNQGAEPVEFPILKVVEREEYNELDIALCSLEKFHWIVFTSTNAVRIVAHRLSLLNRDARAFYNTKIAAIGNVTALYLQEKLGLRADFLPSEAISEMVVEEWPESLTGEMRILIPQSSQARNVIASALSQRGAQVDAIAVYDTILDDSSAQEMSRELSERKIDAITFTSSSTVHNFAQAISPGDLTRVPYLIGDTLIAAIGPITAATARENGLFPQVIAEEHSVAGIVSALIDFYRINS